MTPLLDRRLLLGLAGVLATAPTAAFSAALVPPPSDSQAAPVAVAFGPDPLQAYDLYPGLATGPVLLFVHGGGWARGQRSMVNALPDYCRRHHFTLASTGYRLVPAVSAREEAEDVAAAVASLKSQLPGRPIFLLGHSAGAHLAALIGIDPVYLGAHGLTPVDIAGVILLDGAGYDATLPRGPGFVGQVLEGMYDRAFGDQRARLSPLKRILAGQAYPPFLIFHIASRADSTAQSEALQQALVQVGGQAEVAVADDTHMSINRGFGRGGDPEGERSATFIAMHA
ncbi:alpha/beta hydrolase [soil metagenome]